MHLTIIHLPFLVFLLLFIAILAPLALAVDRKNFRTCKDTPFCGRLRAQAAGGHFDPQDYHLDFSSLEVNEELRTVTASLLNGRHPKQKPLLWKLSILRHGTVRLSINEENPKYQRWEVPDVLQDSALHPYQGDVSWTRQEAEQSLHVAFGETEFMLFAQPFSIVASVQGEKALVLNQHNLLSFEQYREKNPEPADGTQVHDPKELEFPYDRSGAWEYKWGKYTDEIKKGPSAIGLDMSFVGSQHLFGLPEHASDFNLKTTTGGSGGYSEPFRLWNLDVFEYELDEPMALYGAVPLVVSHDQDKTVGALWLNSAETYVDTWDSRDYSGQDEEAEAGTGYLSRLVGEAGKLIGIGGKPIKNVHWMSETGVIDAFLFFGPTPADFFLQYNSLTGFLEMPQSFATAYHQCRWNYKNEKDVQQVDAGFDEHDIPYDVLWLDIEHTDGKRYFTWDASQFPTPEDMQNALASKKRKMVTIIDPHVKRDQNYHVHKEAEEKKLYVQDKDGKSFDGWCWPGSSSYLDFLDPTIRDYWAGLFSYDKYKGSTPHLFTWNDMNEPSVFNGPEVTMPKDNMHLGGTVEHRDVHNLYGKYHHEATALGQYKRSQGQVRPFVLTRSFFAGSQKTAAVWTGDNEAKWSHLDAATPMLLSLNVGGITFSGADVGGFFGDPETELLVRWYQAAAFQPFFRGHAHIDTKRREPWLFGEENTNLIRSAIRQRYSFLPFIYSAFHRSAVTGMPIMRPLWVEFPKDVQGFKVEDQFLLGDALLVKPISQKSQVSTQVYLPGDDNVRWFPLDQWKVMAGGQTWTVASPLSYTPVFQRGGTIIPKKERARRNSALMVNDPYTLIVALDKAGSAEGYLYIDDGSSFDYRQGAYILRKFSFASNVFTSSSASSKSAYPNAPSSTSSTAVEPAATGFPSSCTVERVVVAGLEGEPQKVLLSPGEKELHFRLDSHGRVVVKKPDVGIRVDFSLKFIF